MENIRKFKVTFEVEGSHLLYYKETIKVPDIRQALYGAFSGVQSDCKVLNVKIEEVKVKK